VKIEEESTVLQGEEVDLQAFRNPQEMLVV
jgi:hypothetical protein